MVSYQKKERKICDDIFFIKNPGPQKPKSKNWSRMTNDDKMDDKKMPKMPTKFLTSIMIRNLEMFDA